MPRSAILGGDPILGARSSTCHFIPWVRCTGSSGFWTKTNRNRFTANVLDGGSQTIEIVRQTGSTLRVREWEWKQCIVDYIKMQNPDGIGFERFSRSNRLTQFFGPMLELFFSHLFKDGECFCLNQDTRVNPPPKAKESATSAWDA